MVGEFFNASMHASFVGSLFDCRFESVCSFQHEVPWTALEKIGLRFSRAKSRGTSAYFSSAFVCAASTRQGTARNRLSLLLLRLCAPNCRRAPPSLFEDFDPPEAPYCAAQEPNSDAHAQCSAAQAPYSGVQSLGDPVLASRVVPSKVLLSRVFVSRVLVSRVLMSRVLVSRVSMSRVLRRPGGERRDAQWWDALAGSNQHTTRGMSSDYSLPNQGQPLQMQQIHTSALD